jgi:signal transduction histidine kinase
VPAAVVPAASAAKSNVVPFRRRWVPIAAGALAVNAARDAILAGKDVCLVTGVEVQTAASARVGGDYLARASDYERQRGIDDFTFPALLARRMKANVEAKHVSMDDVAHVAASREHNARELPRLAAGLEAVEQDQAKVQQILANLLSNAVKFTPEGGRVDVIGRLDESEEGPAKAFLIEVVDTGVGIAEEERQTIFEKFRQGHVFQGDDAMTREFSGTGLGLSIVRELCRLLGGDITVESQLGRGSRFTVRLPASFPTEQDGAAVVADAGAPNDAALATAGGPQRA